MRLFTIPVACLFLHTVTLGSTPDVRIPFKERNGLIVAPFVVNGIKLDLIVDSGSPATMLFHNRSSVLNVVGRTKHTASGYGNSVETFASVSLNNHVSMGELALENIAILLVDSNPISTRSGADGIIGYELFLKFEVEIDFASQVMTLRPALENHNHDKFHLLPLEIRGAKAYFKIEAQKRKSWINHIVLVDTGSSLGLLLNEKNGVANNENGKFYKGLNGMFQASELRRVSLRAGNFRIDKIPMTLKEGTDSGGTIGLAFFKKCRVIINYARGYIGLVKGKSQIKGHDRSL